MLNDLVYAINEPLPLGAQTSKTAQRSPADTETGRPRSPIALSPERPLREEHSEGRSTSWLPTSGDMNHAHAGSSFASFASAYPSTMMYMPPILDCLRPDTPSCVPPFASDDSPPHTQSHIAPFGDSSPQCNAPAHAPPSFTPHEHAFLPRYDLRQAEPRIDAPAVPHQGIPGQYQSGMVGRYKSSLEEALSYRQPSPPLGLSRSQAEAEYYSQPRHQSLSGMAMGVEREHADIAIPHFGVMNGAWTTWPNVRPSAG